jgi:hypothetical protein
MAREHEEFLRNDESSSPSTNLKRQRTEGGEGDAGGVAVGAQVVVDGGLGGGSPQPLPVQLEGVPGEPEETMMISLSESIPSIKRQRTAESVGSLGEGGHGEGGGGGDTQGGDTQAGAQVEGAAGVRVCQLENLLDCPGFTVRSQ